MNLVWIFCFALSLIMFIISKTQVNIIELASSSIFESLSLCLQLGVIYIFWCGVIEIIKELQFHIWLAKKSEKLFTFLFPNSNKSSKENIALCLSCNMLGLGNASVPLGLNAISKMEQNTTKYDSTLFIILNCISLQLLPTTLLSIYVGAGGQDFIVLYLLGIGITLLNIFLAVIIAKSFKKRKMI